MGKGNFLAQSQPLVYSQMKKNVEHERLAHAYIFEGDNGCGKHEMALWLAKRLLCLNVTEGKPCEQCVNCNRINEGEHPNVQLLEPDGQTIKVYQIRQLQAELAKSSFEKGMQIFVIQQADKMNPSAANSLLKLLEEPPGNSVAILETNVLGKILPTIQSRCQIVHFSPLAKEHLIKRLEENHLSTNVAKLIANLTNSYDKAVEISEDEWFNETREIISTWFDYLKKGDPQAFIFVQKKVVAQAKEKEQQRMIFAILLVYFQNERDRSLENRQQTQRNNHILELILQAQQKLTANVAFQGTAEQLALRIID
ncbi:DNA polymerase III subunit delta' [Tetragenococcus koreensis]|uniref:DNA polymerase III subunit delta' n=1 Tax=Tetragenococcus koreensis TaxID=290335 RepID=UPI001F1743E0|nr:DNA polymerase III subunit delta' [Tetragenococcus koreensis]MCF1584276.1 DNA polymerase III subunit delta' [Tetragenococcus koreensis]MCF1613790.1 DNA polymerase III subunit delta' [Tetragenococcus koreensis]MCF1620536.1 DNA polymerase III subunit delta' [Tetragenococcus koreensis]MCF1623610.1 DNA polymerase III subunit delta' [Tetragenococcus koreensis]MCF1628514.1 DNA polymerase III subunit delta' [Tetragenococcus koreensis]